MNIEIESLRTIDEETLDDVSGGNSIGDVVCEIGGVLDCVVQGVGGVLCGLGKVVGGLGK